MTAQQGSAKVKLGKAGTILLGTLALAALGQRTLSRAVRPNGSPAAGAQVHLVPEVINVIAGGDNNGRADGNTGVDGVPATQARLGTPAAMAIDSHGNVYLSDTDYGLVRRINAADGTITTVAGTFSGSTGEARRAEVKAQDLRPRGNVAGTQTSLGRPCALATGPADELYIADSYSNVVYRLDPASGAMAVIAGTPGSYGYSPDGTAAVAAMLAEPCGLATDAAGNLFIADASNQVVQKVKAADGTLTTVAGNYSAGGGYAGDGAAATSAQLLQPHGLVLDATGNLFIADSANNVVRRVDATTGNISTFAGNHQNGRTGDGGPATSAQLSNPVALALDAAGQLYISDSESQEVRKVALDGSIATVAGEYSFGLVGGFPFGAAATQTSIGNTAGIAIDSAGALYVAGQNVGLMFKLGPASLLDFQKVPVHGSASLSVLVENTGTASLNFTGNGVTLAGDGFSRGTSPSADCSAITTLGSGGSCSVTVVFSPQQAATYTGTVTITDSAGTQTVTLAGEGVKPSPAVTASVTPQNAFAGEVVTLSATVVPTTGNPTPSGTVTFTDLSTGNVLATASLDGSGAASKTITPPAGSYEIEADYSGDSTYDVGSSDAVLLTVTARPATISLTASTQEANAGDAVSVAATVSASGGTPTGSVEFRVDGAAVATAAITGGTAAASLSAPPPGQHTLQAVYLGDARYGVAFSSTLPLLTHGAQLQFMPGAAVTVAGVPSDDLHGSFSGDGGPAIAAHMHTVAGVASDGAGNIYIADEQNNVIRKVSTSGIISTIAGIPYAGSIYSTRYGGDGGPATSAYLDNPTAVVVDPAGNIFIADYSNSVVRRVDAVTGTISTYAGNYPGNGNHGNYNGTDGTATAVYLNNPSALALDGAGNLYIADSGNNLVRKVTPAGVMSTIAGSYYQAHNGSPVSGQPATSVDLYRPMGVAVDHSGLVYIADTQHGLIRKIDAAGNLITVAGTSSYAASADNVPATSTTLKSPEQMVFDAAGNLYFAETSSYVIRKIDPAGIITTPVGYFGSSTAYYYFDPAGQPATNFQLVTPASVAIDPNGSLLVADTFNQTVIRVGPNGSLYFGPDNGDADPQTLTLFNSGDRAVTFGATPYIVSGNYTVTAEGASPCSFTAGLQPGANCTLAVRNHQGTDGTIAFATNTGTQPVVKLHTNSMALTTTTTLALSENSGNVGDNVLIYAQVSASGPPVSGKVEFYDGSTLLNTATISSGIAYIYTSTLTAGSHTITAKFLGGGLYGVSTSDPQTLVLSGASTVTTLASSAASVSYGTSVTFTANVQTSGSVAVTTGSVNFYDGSVLLGTRNVDSNGTASLATATLATGTHSITAAYIASGSYAGSTSAALSLTVSGGGGVTQTFDYDLTVTGGPLVIHRGESKTLSITAYLQSTNYGGVVTLSCGTLPSYATCSFSPPYLILSGPITVNTSILTITAAPPDGSGAQAQALRITPFTRGGAVQYRVTQAK